MFDGLVAPRSWGKRQTPCPPAFQHNDTPCVSILFPLFLLIDIAVEPSGGASGQASDIAIHAKEILRVREVLTGIYQKHCGHDGESLQDGLERFSALRV